MEVNTVVLALGEYNALRDFKTNLEKGNTHRYIGYQQVSNYVSAQVVCFVTTDEAVKEAVVANEKLTEEISKLTNRINELEHPMASPKEISVDYMKKMSIWEFRKWRKQR
jgi:hypothetical protein